MLFYIAVCKKCNYLMSSEDIALLKIKISMHMTDSHGYPDTFLPQLVSLNDFREVCNITFIKGKAQIRQLKESLKTQRFWQVFRNLSKIAS